MSVTENEAANVGLSPLEVYREWQRRIATQQFDHMGEVVDLEGYTEICLGLTGWTTGFEVALRNYIQNMVTPWSDMRMTEEEAIEDQDAVVVRNHIEATHTGEFLGIPATGRRIAWDAVSIVRVRDGRVVGQWAQSDLWGIHQQLLAGGN
jgi:predicted ester cyclase